VCCFEQEFPNFRNPICFYPTCEEPLTAQSAKELRKNVSEAVIQSKEDKMLATLEVPGHITSSCGNCGVGFVMTYEDLQQPELTCSHCKATICTDHKTAIPCHTCTHGTPRRKEPETTQKNTKEIQRKALEGYACPGFTAFQRPCGVFIAKGDDACNKLTCTQCKTPSCAWCGNEVRDYSTHFCRSKETEWVNKFHCERCIGDNHRHCPLWPRISNLGEAFIQVRKSFHLWLHTIVCYYCSCGCLGQSAFLSTRTQNRCEECERAYGRAVILAPGHHST